jgi:hypothetical protein
MIINCLNCLKELDVKPYEVNVRGRKYCGIDCFSEHQKRSKPTSYPQTRKCKFSLCEKTFFIENYRQAIKKYCSQSCAAIASNKSRKGIKYDGSTITFRTDLLILLGHNCIICGYDKFVDAHHIIPRRLNGSNHVSNGAILCPNHHKEAGAELISSLQLKEARDVVLQKRGKTIPL